MGTRNRPKLLLLSVAVLMGTPLPTLAWTMQTAQTQTQTPATQRPATQTPATQAPALRLPPGTTFVTEVEGIREYRLANGLKVLLFPDATKQNVTINTTYLVGSRSEGYGETGMAHLLEHLVFKGTPKHPNIPGEFKERGVDFNGTTSDERTNYFMTMPATNDNLKWGLGLEADRMVNSFIAKRDLDSEMTVVRNEFEAGENDPASVLVKSVLSAAYDWHNYGNATIGNRSDVENVPIERLQAFYRRYYQPDNAVVLLAGKFDPQLALDTIAATFGKVAKPARVLPREYTVEPPRDGERSVTVRRVGEQQIMIAAYHVPSALHPDYAAVDVMTDLLGDTPSGRLHRALVETGAATDVGGFGRLRSGPTLSMFYTFLPRGADAAPVRDTFLKTIEEFAASPPTQAEVDRIKALNERGFDAVIADPAALGVSLSEFMALGDWRTFFFLRDAIQKVTPADVQRVARTYLRPVNRTLGQFVPTERTEAVAIPAAPPVADVLRGYQGRAAVAAGEALQTEPLALEGRVRRETAAGGLKIATLPYRSRGSKVELTLDLKFGSETSLRGRTTAAGFVAAMLERGSTGLSRQELQDRLARLKSTMSVSGSATGATVRISSDRQNLPEVLKLMGTVLRQPLWPATEFEQLKREAISSVEAGRTDPEAVASLAFERHFMPANARRGDVRYVPTLDEQLADLRALTLDDVRKFYADFWGSNVAFAGVVGDFDAPAVSAQLRQTLQGWTSKTPYERVRAVNTQPAAVNTVLPVPDKANAVFVAGLSIRMRDESPDYPAMVVANYILGGGGLSSRLADRLRQKDGLSYSVGSGFSADPRDEDALFQAYAIYNPENAAKLEQGFREELARAVRAGFTDAEVAAAKGGLLQARVLARTGDATLARSLATQQDLGRTFRTSAELDAKIAALTTAQVNAALRKYVDPAKVSVFKVGTFR